MLMQIILQVRKKRGDVATGHGNEFFVVKSSHQEKSSRTQQGECHSVCTSPGSERETEREREKNV